MQTGSVKWFDDAKGYGFIATEEGKEVFVHHTGINATGRRTLHEGQQVEFEMGVGPSGRPQAVNVTVI